MSKGEILQKNATAEAAWDWLVRSHFQEPILTELGNQFKAPPDSEGYNYKNLIRFLDEYIKPRFPKQWEYESGPDWDNRSGIMAARESILHLLAIVSEEAELRVKGTYDRVNLTAGDWKSIESKGRFLFNFFKQQIPLPDKSEW